MTFAWTDETFQRAAELRRKGVPYSEIATEIGCHSRNAVIGKLKRAGLLPKRGAGNGDPRTRAEKMAAAAERRDSMAAGAVPAAMDIPHEPSKHAVALLDVQHHHCRWPLNDPGPDFLFCGAIKSTGSSYCERHHQRSLQRTRATPVVSEAERARRSAWAKQYWASREKRSGTG